MIQERARDLSTLMIYYRRGKVCESSEIQVLIKTLRFDEELWRAVIVHCIAKGSTQIRIYRMKLSELYIYIYQASWLHGITAMQ